MNRHSSLSLVAVAFAVAELALTTTHFSAQAQAGTATPAPTQPAYPATLSADQQVKITFYSYNLASAGVGADGTKQLISEFMALHPNITVEGVGVSSPDIIARTQADVAAGNPPDVAQLVFSDLDFIVNNFAIQPLEKIVPPAELAQDFAGFSPNGLKLGQLNGLTYGLAFTFSTPVLFYNADIFKAAGLDPAKPPTTWDEVKADAQQIVAKTGNQGVFIDALGTFDWMFQSLVLSNGGRVLSEDRKTLMFADPPAVGAVRMWQDLIQSGAHPKLTQADAITAFSGGKLGMMVETSALQNAFIAASTGKFDLRDARMPAFAGKPVVPTNSGSALFIFPTDPVKQRAAWEFVKFVTSERGYTIITSKIGYLPLRPAIVNDPQYLQGWVKDHPLVQPNLEQLSSLQPWVSFPGPNYRQIVKTMMDAVQQAIYGTDDVQSILGAAQTQAQQFMPQ